MQQQQKLSLDIKNSKAVLVSVTKLHPYLQVEGNDLDVLTVIE